MQRLHFNLELFRALLSAKVEEGVWSPAAPLLPFPLSCFSLASSLISIGLRACFLSDDIKVGPWVSSCKKFSAAAGKGGMTGR